MDWQAYIEERSIPEPMSGCWIWLLSTASHGYGNAFNGVTVVLAHRLSHEAFIGPIPAGMLVQHSCDNRWCVAPHHLSLGTDASNAADKQAKGRAAKKLTARDVRTIAECVRLGVESRALAARFGVTKSLVQKIATGRVWRSVLGIAATPGICHLCEAPTVDAFVTCERCRTNAEARKKLRRSERAARAAAGPLVTKIA